MASASYALFFLVRSLYALVLVSRRPDKLLISSMKFSSLNSALSPDIAGVSGDTAAAADGDDSAKVS